MWGQPGEVILHIALDRRAWLCGQPFVVCTKDAREAVRGQRQLVHEPPGCRTAKLLLTSIARSHALATSVEQHRVGTSRSLIALDRP